MKDNATLVPDIVCKAQKLVPSLKNRPAWMKPHSADRIERILASHRAAEQGFKTFAVGVILAGTDLARLRSEVGSHWPDVLTSYLEPAGISQRHVDRYCEVAANASRKHRVDVEGLLRSPQSVDAETWAKLSEHVQSSTTAPQWRALIDGIGLARKETRGGYRPDPQLLADYCADKNMPEDFDKWTKDQQQEYRAWEKGQRKRPDTSETDGDAANRRLERALLPVLQGLSALSEAPALLYKAAPETRKHLAALCRQVARLADSEG